ncbi:MAG: Asp23/Gls24 family envelope stress response protein [Clostridiaceae bacterium]|nr:Asp23/Gls24 family envelope stress response protein [Eubacteriales bacterium]
MSQETEVYSQITADDGGGKIIFATDVIATIAGLAATEVEGVDSLSGTVVEGITGMLASKKNFTKGIKVEVKEDEVALDMSLTVKYGTKIHEVCRKVQQSVKNAVETMTGLRVTMVNISVQSVTFEKAEIKETKKEKDKAE